MAEIPGPPSPLTEDVAPVETHKKKTTRSRARSKAGGGGKKKRAPRTAAGKALAEGKEKGGSNPGSRRPSQAGLTAPPTSAPPELKQGVEKALGGTTTPATGGKEKERRGSHGRRGSHSAPSAARRPSQGRNAPPAGGSLGRKGGKDKAKKVAHHTAPTGGMASKVIPPVVRRCVEFLEDNALEEEGLFRQSPKQDAVTALKDKFARNHGDYDLTGYKDPHVVAALLKAYFREHPSFVPDDFYDTWVTAWEDGEDNAGCADALAAEVDTLPSKSKAIIEFLARFLARVARHHRTNGMSASNLAIVWGPTFVGGSAGTASEFVKCLITQVDEIFGEEF